jgi:hypothetical protein
VPPTVIEKKLPAEVKAEVEEEAEVETVSPPTRVIPNSFFQWEISPASDSNTS